MKQLSCLGGNCQICNVLKLGKEIRSAVTRVIYKINFHFDCNSLSVVYLITCKVCKKQYTDSNVSKSRARFNQYKSYMVLYAEDRKGCFQEKQVKHF